MATAPSPTGQAHHRARTTMSPPQPPPQQGGLAPTGAFPYCQRAQAMLAELKRAEWLPRYDEEGVRLVLEECRKLFRMQEDMRASMSETEPGVATSLNVFNYSMARNRRCLLAYVRFRQEKIEALWWDSGAAPLVEPYVSKLSQRECEHYVQFGALMSECMNRTNLTLTNRVQPPRNLFIEVRALTDAGAILLESGTEVVFEKNSTHFLRRSDVEQMIRQNVLEEVRQ